MFVFTVSWDSPLRPETIIIITGDSRSREMLLGEQLSQQGELNDGRSPPFTGLVLQPLLDFFYLNRSVPSSSLSLSLFLFFPLQAAVVASPPLPSHPVFSCMQSPPPLHLLQSGLASTPRRQQQLLLQQQQQQQQQQLLLQQQQQQQQQLLL